jgi:hypothetical protein
VKPGKAKPVVKISSYRYKDMITVRIGFGNRATAQFVADRIKKATEKAVAEILAELDQ